MSRTNGEGVEGPFILFLLSLGTVAVNKARFTIAGHYIVGRSICAIRQVVPYV